MSPPLYPLKFEPIYKAKVWGGRNLEKLGRRLPGDASTLIGESWEVADLDASSPSGGGGYPERSRVRNGRLKGALLHDLIDEIGFPSTGQVENSPHSGFPLLVKFIDAQENLSVQVHPGPAYVSVRPGVHPKFEAYYVVDAVPGAVIYKGLKRGVTERDFRAAVASGVTEQVEALLNRIAAIPGDTHYLPGGTCHAIGAGVLLAEIQTPSDTTFRLFDWGRSGRELHIDEGMRSIDFCQPDLSRYEPRTQFSDGVQTTTRHVASDHFRIDEVVAPADYRRTVGESGPAIWIVLEGEGEIDLAGDEESVPFTRGETLLIPGNLPDVHVRVLLDSSWLEVTLP